MGYYDKKGNPLTLEEWASIFERKELGYKRVDKTTLSDGKWVSTVWLGIDHGFGMAGPPLIFETMVFPSEEGPFRELDMARYSTLEEAQAGHDAMVRKWAPKSLMPGEES